MNKFYTLIAITLLSCNIILCDPIKKPTKKISLPLSLQILGRTFFNNDPKEVARLLKKFKKINNLNETNSEDKERIENLKTLLEYPGFFYTTPSGLFTKATESIGTKFGETVGATLGTAVIGYFGFKTPTK